MKFIQPRRLFFLLFLAILQTFASRPTLAADAPPQIVSVAARKVCDLSDPRISESSGLGASRRYPGYFWTHNDSGGQARVFLFSPQGQTRAVVTLEGAQAQDWEELTVSGTGKNAWVYVADIGDNGQKRPSITIYRFREPQLSPGIETSLSVKPEAMTLSYPDGPHDAEVLLISPQGHLVIVTKTLGTSLIYQSLTPFGANTSGTLQQIGNYQFGVGTGDEKLGLTSILQTIGNRLTTAGDVSGDGKHILIRTYGWAYQWTLPPGGSWAEIWNSIPHAWKLPDTRQGEAICYSVDGKTVFVTSEGLPTPLYEMMAP